MKYPVSKPSHRGNELKYLTSAIEQEFTSHLGPTVKLFEENFAQYVGTKYAVSCTSGTTALTLALAALKIAPGDEVIVPEFTMIASAWSVTYLGATPVFVDCGDDLNVDISQIEAAITPKTKAIMPVHVYGRPCNMDEIMRIAYEYNLYVVEDACEAIGASWKEKKVGSIGDVGCFSLYANKIITSGEGGIITTNDERIYKQLCHLRSMAFNKEHSFYHPKLAYNFRMTNIQACVALAQLEKIDEFLAKRKEICGWYDKYLTEKTKRIPREEGSVLWMYDLLVNERRDELIQCLRENSIESRPFFRPMSEQAMYRNKTYASLRAYQTSRRGLYLPTYTDLTENDIKFISNKVNDFICN